MNLLEYALNSLLYLLSIGFILVAINGFTTGGDIVLNSFLFALGLVEFVNKGYTLLTNPVNWHDEIF